MSCISPKLINVEGCRIVVDRTIERQLDNEMMSGTIMIGKSMFGKKLKRNDNFLEAGRFPTQLFTNSKNEMFKYVNKI